MTTIFCSSMPHEVIYHIRRFEDLKQGQYHNWLLRLACLWVRYGQSAEDCIGVLREFRAHVDHRDISDSELERFLKYAESVADEVGGGDNPHFEGDYACPHAISIAMKRLEETDRVFDGMPVMIDDPLRHLFDPDELLFVAQHPASPALVPVVDIVPQEWAFIVPNPVLCHGSRVKENFKCRRFLIAEFDGVSKGDQLKRIAFIAEFLAPVKMIVWSGGKSFHAWLDMSEITAQYHDIILQGLWSLGADMHMRSINQYCRMPDGLRYDGQEQDQWVAYWDSEEEE